MRIKTPTTVKITDTEQLTKKNLVSKGFQLLFTSLSVQRVSRTEFNSLLSQMNISKGKATEIWNELLNSTDCFHGGNEQCLYFKSIKKSSKIKRCYYQKERDGVIINIPIGASNWQTVAFKTDEVEGICHLKRIFKTWAALAKAVATLDKDENLIVKSQSSIADEIGVDRTTVYR